MRKVVITSNMLNEAENNLEDWIVNMQNLTDTGIIVVDGGSTDGTQEILRKEKVIVIEDDIIQREGYGPARNHLRELAKEHFPDAHWNCFFDCDERIDPSDFHRFHWIKDYLNEHYFDVVAFPRIDWYDYERIRSANNIRITPDPQARMTRLAYPIKYVRMLHEQVVPSRGMYFNIENCPPIHHFNRPAPDKNRKRVGKVCASLHMRDSEFGHTYPMHPKEQKYRDLLEKEGLND